MKATTRVSLAKGLLLAATLALIAGVGSGRAQRLIPLGPLTFASPGANITRVQEIGEPEPTVSIMDITEPLPCYEGEYENWPPEDIVADVIDLYRDHGYVVGVPTIHRLVDLYPADAEGLGYSPETLFYGCVPDLAVVLEGEFHWWDPGNRLREEPYVLLVIDRRIGLWHDGHSGDLQKLLDMLPPP